MPVRPLCVHGVTLALRKPNVDCWIGITDKTGRRVVRLAGRLTAEQVPDLLAACVDAGSLELDLTDLVSADVVGIDALQRLPDKGVRLVGTPRYIQLKLDSRAAGPIGARRPQTRHSRPPHGML